MTTLLNIRENIRNSKEITNRVAFRLAQGDLDAFLLKLKGIELKQYFQDVLNQFHNIEEFEDIDKFVYKYTKEKSYTIVLNLEHCQTLNDLSNELNLNESDILRYIVEIANETRRSRDLELGISPRGTIALLSMAKANAYLEGRDYVIPQDVKDVFFETIEHRVIRSKEAKVQRKTKEEILKAILYKIPLPKGNQKG